MAKLVARTYGEALFEMAMEKQMPDAFLQEAQGILAVLKENSEFDRLMKDPKISKPEKEAVLEAVFSGQVSREMIGFLKLLVQKDRYGEVREILRYFAGRLKEAQKIGVAYVTTAVALSEKQQQAVRQKLLDTTGYQVMEMHYSTDAGLIGGMIIRIKDRVVDSSVRTKLEDLKKQLLQIQLG